MLNTTLRYFLAGLCFCLIAISAAALTSSTIFCCTFLALLLFGYLLFARLLISSQAKPVAVKRHRKRGRLKSDTAVSDSIRGFSDSKHMSLASNISQNDVSISTRVSDGKATFSNWPESQRDAFSKAARYSDFKCDQMFLALATLTKLQLQTLRRAEIDFQEGLFEQYLTIEGLPPNYGPCEVGQILHQIDNKLNALRVAEYTTVLDRLCDISTGYQPKFCTAVVYGILMSRPLLDFIDRRITGPLAAQNLFFRRGAPEVSVWSSLTVVRTPRIQSILKMLKLCGLSKLQAENLFMCCLKRSVAALCPDVSTQLKTVRILDIRLAARPGWVQEDKMFRTPEHIPWEEGLIEMCFESRAAADTLLQCCVPLTIILGEEHSLPILTAEISLRRKLSREELDGLEPQLLLRLRETHGCVNVIHKRAR
jgi:hypothetical protein